MRALTRRAATGAARRGRPGRGSGGSPSGPGCRRPCRGEARPCPTLRGAGGTGEEGQRSAWAGSQGRGGQEGHLWAWRAALGFSRRTFHTPVAMWRPRQRGCVLRRLRGGTVEVDPCQNAWRRGGQRAQQATWRKKRSTGERRTLLHNPKRNTSGLSLSDCDAARARTTHAHVDSISSGLSSYPSGTRRGPGKNTGRFHTSGPSDLNWWSWLGKGLGNGGSLMPWRAQHSTDIRQAASGALGPARAIASGSVAV